MELKEKKSVTQEVTIGYRCDVCRKEFKDGEEVLTLSGRHGAWGNDSHESALTWHACSMPCLIESMSRAENEFGDERTAEYSLESTGNIGLNNTHFKAILSMLKASSI